MASFARSKIRAACAAPSSRRRRAFTGGARPCGSTAESSSTTALTAGSSSGVEGPREHRPRNRNRGPLAAAATKCHRVARRRMGGESSISRCAARVCRGVPCTECGSPLAVVYLIVRNRGASSPDRSGSTGPDRRPASLPACGRGRSRQDDRSRDFCPSVPARPAGHSSALVVAPQALTLSVAPRVGHEVRDLRTVRRSLHRSEPRGVRPRRVPRP